MRPPGDVDFADGDTPPTMGGTGPGSAPTTEYREVPLGGCSAAVAQVGDEGAHVDRQGNILYLARTSGPGLAYQLRRPVRLRRSQECARAQQWSMPPLPFSTMAARRQLFAEYMFASGVGEPMAVEGDFGAVEPSKGLVLNAGDGCERRRRLYGCVPRSSGMAAVM
jgi:hypothetical protein